MMVVDVIHPDGRSTRHEIGGAEILLGTSADAGITVPGAPELEPFHLLLSPRTGGCWVSVARAAGTTATVGGQKFENGLVTFGTEIDVGSVTLRIVDASRESRRSTRRWAAVAAVASVAGWLLLQGGPTDTLPRSNAEAPQLFQKIVGCPETGESARRRARDALEIASAKAQRYPYEAQDGIQSVELLALAEACFAAAGRFEEAAGTRAERQRCIQKIEEDYQIHRLRLDRALREASLVDLALQSRALLRLVAHRPGPYREWLTQLLRHVEVQLEVARGGKT